MNVLLLGPSATQLLPTFSIVGDSVRHVDEPITASSSEIAGMDFLVSFGYRHIIRRDVLEQFPERVINLHISYLPWNRGADPNLWSFLKDSPKGVTIHQIDEGIDTGPILAQMEVPYESDDTLRTSYARLNSALVSLFSRSWGELRIGRLSARPQPHDLGTAHRAKDKEHYAFLLSQQWDTPVAELIGKASRKSGENHA